LKKTVELNRNPRIHIQLVNFLFAVIWFENPKLLGKLVETGITAIVATNIHRLHLHEQGPAIAASTASTPPRNLKPPQ
jgi:hypothetical protein